MHPLGTHPKFHDPTHRMYLPLPSTPPQRRTTTSISQVTGNVLHRAILLASYHRLGILLFSLSLSLRIPAPQSG